MPMPRVNSQFARSESTEEVIVREHLSDLRGRVRFFTWLSGLAWLAIIFFGGLLLTGTLDWLFHFDESGTRLLFGVALLIATTWVGWKFLIAPLRQKLTGPFLASRVERRFPDFKGRIVSAVEFLEHRMDQRLGSPELQRAVVGQALNDLSSIDTSDIVESRAIRKISFAGLAVLSLVMVVLVLRPLEAATSIQRLLFPFSKIAWPRAVELELVNADLSRFPLQPGSPTLIARGDTLELYVRNKRGHLPERVWFEFRQSPGGQVVREVLRRTTLRDEKDQAYEAALINWIAVSGKMSFRVAGGDDTDMPFQEVEVVIPPVIKTLQVTVTPPTYSRFPKETLPPGVGHVSNLLGSRVDIEAQSDKLLKSANLRIGDAAAVPLELSSEGDRFTASFKITEPTMSRYWFELTDQQGFSDREPVRFELRGIADLVPDVVIESPVTDVQLTSSAELPVQILAKDDLGIREVRIAYQINDDETLKMISLFQSAANSVASPTESPVSALPAVDQDHQQQHVEYLWKMSDLNVKAGTKILFRGEATDRYDLGEPHVGKSIPRTITIVSSEEKQKELAARVGSILEEIDKVAQLQQRAQQETKEIQTQLENVGELRTQDLDQLRRADLDQRQTASRLTHPADGVQSKAQQLIEEFRANQLNDERTEQRLESLSSELDRLSQEEFPRAEQALTLAQKLAESESATKSSADSDKSDGNSSQDRKNDRPPASPSKPNPSQKTPNSENSSTPQAVDQHDLPKSASENAADSNQPAGAPKSGDDQHSPPETKASPSSEEAQKNATTSENKPEIKTQKINETGDTKSSDTELLDDGLKDKANPPTDAESKSPSPDAAPEENSNETADSKSTPTAAPHQVGSPKSNSPREKAIESALNEAFQRQSQAVETLRELQQSLSEWRDRRDVSRDLESVMSEQQSLQQEAAELAAKTMSKSSAELTKQDKAELSKLAAKQRKIAEQLEQFQKQLNQTAESLQKNDPETAEKLKDVDSSLTEKETSSLLQDAAQEIAENRMGAAAETQQKALEELQEVERMMKRQPNDDTEQFVRQTDEALQEFQQLRQEQQDLADQAHDLSQQPDSPEKMEQMEKLKDQQQELSERMAKAERKLERLRLRGAAESVNRARTRLNEMMQQIEDADDADVMQQAMDEAVEDLEQTEREIALEKRVAQERLAFEQLEKIEDELKALRTRQETVIEETTRLETARSERDSLSRGQLRTLKDLGETERSLQQQAEQLQRQMASAEVFSLVLKRLARSLGNVADRLNERDTSTMTQTLEAEAIRKINSLLAVLKKDEKPKQKAEQQQPQEELTEEPQAQEDKPEEAQPPGESIPQLAQLKLLKAMQEEYLERTEMLNKLRDKNGQLPDHLRAEQSELAREQVELADFARNLVAKFQQQLPDRDDVESPSKSTRPGRSPTSDKKSDDSEKKAKAEKPDSERKPEPAPPQKEKDPSKIDL